MKPFFTLTLNADGLSVDLENAVVPLLLRKNYKKMKFLFTEYKYDVKAQR